MEIIANRTTCIGSGQCVFTDPDIFDQDDDGLVVLLRPDVQAPQDVSNAREAANVCPSRSLRLAVSNEETPS